MITDDKKVQSHYDEYSFDNFTESTLRNLKENSLVGYTLEHYAKNDSLLLDAGCGTGKLFVLAKSFNVGSLIAIDLSLNSLKLARQREQKAKVVNGSLLELPLRDNVVSLIVSSGVIHHTSNPEAAFVECCRVLDVGGAFCVTVYNKEHRYHGVYKHVGGFFRRMNSNATLRFLLRYLLIPFWYVYYCGLRSMMTTGKLAKLSFKRSINLFYDRYMISQAFFFTTQEMISWGEKYGLDLVKHQRMGAMIEFLFIKKNNE